VRRGLVRCAQVLEEQPRLEERVLQHARGRVGLLEVADDGVFGAPPGHAFCGGAARAGSAWVGGCRGTGGEGEEGRDVPPPLTRRETLHARFDGCVDEVLLRYAVGVGEGLRE
jgi:hypothetical protein